MHTHPTVPLQALLQGKPIDYSLDYYPQPWSKLFAAVRSTPPFTQMRQAALEAAVAALSDSALDQLERSLTDPLVIASHLNLNARQELVIAALKSLGQSRPSHIARAVRRDRSNIYHSLQSLVSLGIVDRHKSGREVLYRLRQPHPQGEKVQNLEND